MFIISSTKNEKKNTSIFEIKNEQNVENKIFTSMIILCFIRR